MEATDERDMEQDGPPSSSSKPPSSLSTTDEKKFTAGLVEMIIRDMQPLSIVEGAGFLDFVNTLNPSYLTPNAYEIRNNLLPPIRALLTRKVTDILKDTDDLCLVLEHWPNERQQQVDCIAISVHFITRFWKKQSVMLGIFRYDSERDDQPVKVADRLTEFLRKWPDVDNKISAVVIDRRSVDTLNNNLKAAIDLLGWKRVECFVHTMNDIVQHGFRLIDNLNRKAIETVNYLLRNHDRLLNLPETLLNSLSIPNSAFDYNLSNSSETRWNLDYDLLKTIYPYRAKYNAILRTTTVLLNERSSLVVLSRDEWETLNDVGRILELFQGLKRECAGDASISVIIVLIQGLVTCLRRIQSSSPKLRPSTMKFVEGLHDEIWKHFYPIEYQSLITRACYLDPRFKKITFIDLQGAGEAISDSIIEELLSTVISANEAETVGITVGEAAADNKPGGSGGGEHSAAKKPHVDYSSESLWRYFDSRILGNPKVQVSTVVTTSDFGRSNYLKELAGYNDEVYLNRKEDPLQWWRDREAVYPYLARLAKRYLNIPLCCSSSSCDDEPCSYAATTTDKRRRVRDEDIDLLIFLNGNIHLYNGGQHDSAMSSSEDGSNISLEIDDSISSKVDYTTSPEIRNRTASSTPSKKEDS